MILVYIMMLLILMILKIFNEKYLMKKNNIMSMKILRFVKKVFFLGLTILSNFTNALSATPLSCISMKKQECKTRPQVININSNNPIFYPFSIKINVVVIVIILIIHIQKFVFLML